MVLMFQSWMLEVLVPVTLTTARVVPFGENARHGGRLSVVFIVEMSEPVLTFQI